MNDLPLYEIVDYDDHFENYKSRTRDQCAFVCVPNKHGGTGLANVLGEPDGLAIYGGWMLLLQLCSRQRKPRHGYLTADGKKEGRRLGAAELSRLLRRPVEEIHRCLHVVSSPEVGFIRLLDGHPEDTERILQVPETDTTEPLIVTDTEGIPKGQDGIPGRDAERKKERKNLSLSELEQGSRRDTEGIQAKDAADTNLIPPAPVGIADEVQHAEAKRIFGKLSNDVFGEPLAETQWPNDMEHWLDAALPMRRENVDLIDWFYRLPADHEIFTVTRRRQSLAALIGTLKSESQKIRSARKTIGLNGLQDRQPGTGCGDGWTALRKQAAFEEFGESITLPAMFDQLPVDLQRRVDERAKKSGVMG